MDKDLDWLATSLSEKFPQPTRLDPRSEYKYFVDCGVYGNDRNQLAVGRFIPRDLTWIKMAELQVMLDYLVSSVYAPSEFTSEGLQIPHGIEWCRMEEKFRLIIQPRVTDGYREILPQEWCWIDHKFYDLTTDRVVVREVCNVLRIDTIAVPPKTK